jgi:O-antigen/teichoic acid export membrane protein
VVAARLVIDRDSVKAVYRQAMKCVFLLMLPAVFVLFLFAGEGLTWWVGADFAENGQQVARILLMGVFANALGQVAITVLHGAGRADWAAKLHLVELPVYMAALMFAAGRYGIDGVAFVWLLRVAVDMVIMLVLVDRLLLPDSPFLGMFVLAVGVVMAAMWFSGMMTGVFPRSLAFCVVLLACGTLLPRQLRALIQATRHAA